MMQDLIFAAIVLSTLGSSNGELSNRLAKRSAACAADVQAVGAVDTPKLEVVQGAAASNDEQSGKKPKRKKSKAHTEQAVDAGERDLRAAWNKRPSLRYGSVFRLDFEAKFQEDAHASYSGARRLDPFELHRNRIGVQGRFFKHIEYEVERELTEKEADPGKLPKSPWKDVYVNASLIKSAQIQAGKFKIPFGLDQLTGVTQNDYVYRSLGATYLAPGREVGAMMHGRFFKRGLSYWAGVFTHDGEHARSKKIQGGDETVAARVAGRPFRPMGVHGLELGTAFTVSALSDQSFEPNGLRGRTVMTRDTFFHAVYVNGHRRRWEADLDWTFGPASARAEYTWVRDDRLQQGIGEEDLPDARARSWFISGTWVLTGEPKRRPLEPAHEFLHGGWGAVEVAGRSERLWFDSAGGAGTDTPFRGPRARNILPSGDRVVTVGVNWTLNRWMKLQVNGIREHVEDPARSPVPHKASFWSRVVRLQFVL